jgi:hypothetical protein
MATSRSLLNPGPWQAPWLNPPVVLICEPRGATFIRHGLTYFICRTCGYEVGSFRRRVCPEG